MDNPAFMRCFAKSIDDLLANAQCFLDRKRAQRYARRERGSVDQLQNQREQAVGLFQSINGCNVWMVQRGKHLRLPLKPAYSLGIIYKAFRQDLQRHVAAQLRIARTVHPSPIPPVSMISHTS